MNNEKERIYSKALSQIVRIGMGHDPGDIKKAGKIASGAFETVSNIQRLHDAAGELLAACEVVQEWIEDNPHFDWPRPDDDDIVRMHDRLSFVISQAKSWKTKN